MLRGLRNTVCMMAFVLVAVGCASMGRDLETPRFSVLGITVDEIGLFEQRFAVRLRVQNPNDIALPVKGLNLELDIQGEEFARGVSADRFEVPAFGESEFTMVVSTNLVRSATQLGTLFAPGTEEVDYSVDGKVNIDLPFMGSVPLKARGQRAADARAALVRAQPAPGQQVSGETAKPVPAFVMLAADAGQPCQRVALCGVDQRRPARVRVRKPRSYALQHRRARQVETVQTQRVRGRCGRSRIRGSATSDCGRAVYPAGMRRSHLAKFLRSPSSALANGPRRDTGTKSPDPDGSQPSGQLRSPR